MGENAIDRREVTCVIWDTSISRSSGEHLLWTFPLMGHWEDVAPAGTGHMCSFASPDIRVHVVVRDTVHPDDVSYAAAQKCAETMRDSLKKWSYERE